jgi:hypothetical protein
MSLAELFPPNSKIRPHPLRPPQNEPGATASVSGSGTHQREEPRLRETKTVLQKYWTIRGYLNIHSCPDRVQLILDHGQKINYRATIQHITRQTRGAF